MPTVWKIIKRCGVVVGPIVFATSVALATRDIAELGLPWYWWAAIGGAIFFASGFAIIYGQHKENAKLQKELKARSDISTQESVSSRVFAIEAKEYEFGSSLTEGFPKSDKGYARILRVSATIIAIPAIKVESIQLDLMDTPIPPNLEQCTMMVGLGVISQIGQYLYFEIPNRVNPGEHTVKLVAFGQGMRTESESSVIEFPKIG